MKGEFFQLKGNVGFRADHTNLPRKMYVPSNFQTSDNQSSDILRQPFKWTCRTRNTNDLTIDCKLFRRRLCSMVLAITAIINRLFIPQLTLKGQMSIFGSSRTNETWFPRGFCLGLDSPVDPLVSEKRLLAASPH